MRGGWQRCRRRLDERWWGRKHDRLNTLTYRAPNTGEWFADTCALYDAIVHQGMCTCEFQNWLGRWGGVFVFCRVIIIDVVQNIIISILTLVTAIDTKKTHRAVILRAIVFQKVDAQESEVGQRCVRYLKHLKTTRIARMKHAQRMPFIGWCVQ